MTVARVRPRFIIRTALPPHELMQLLRERLPECPHCTGVSVGLHAELDVPRAERRFWSPHLSVTAEQCENDETLLRGRFGPHPHLWTLYMFFALGLGFGLLVGMSWGYAQWVMETTFWALISIPVGALLATLLYVSALIGQRLGNQQMTVLREGLEELTLQHGRDEPSD